MTEPLDLIGALELLRELCKPVVVTMPDGRGQVCIRRARGKGSFVKTLIDVREHDKIEFGVLIERVPPGRRRQHMLVEKGRLGEEPLEILPHRFAPARALIGFQRRAAILTECIE